MDKITQIVNALLSTSLGNMPYASVLAMNDNDAGKQRKLFEFCSHAAKKPTRLPNAVETQWYMPPFPGNPDASSADTSALGTKNASVATK